jgi:hypothetical protein
MEYEDAALAGVACLMVVQRDDIDRFRLLSTTFQGHPVQIIWDRRIADRRRSAALPPVDRRSGDRRQPPPESWGNLGFLVARSTNWRVTA